MSKPAKNVLELPFLDSGLLALRAAVEKVIEEHAREGRSLYTLRDGKVVAALPKNYSQEMETGRARTR